MVEYIELVATVGVWVVFGLLLFGLAVVVPQYIGYRWPRLAVPYHMARGAWYAARYPGGTRRAANMLRDERAMFVKARIARVIGADTIDTEALDATLAKGRAIVARRRRGG